MSEICYHANSLDDIPNIAKEIVTKLSLPARVHLDGEMGAGKTTLCKALMHALGYEGEVTSPTYNLVQAYPTPQGLVQHMDLYRLEDPSELEFLALEDLWLESSLFLIEWPERGQGWLSEPNFTIQLSGDSQQNPQFRKIILKELN